MSDFEIKIEMPVSTPLKNIQKENLLNQLDDMLNSSDSKRTSSNITYVEKRGVDVQLVMVAALGISASILGIVSSVLSISKNLGGDVKSAVFVKRGDGTYAKIDDGMTSEDVKKLLD